ncbi:WhiB family transcriptional regulator [Streptomyces albus]|uniref:WhiB family transcriptional regulator n=1 Tax=Streptomyces albus TaxID=1888 RepID=UPI003F1A9D3A
MRTITTHEAPATALRGIADTSWHVRGECHGMDPEDADATFFPPPGDHQAIAEAKSLCEHCPVSRECFTYALDNEIREGIWGGLTPVERRPWHVELDQRLDYSRVRATFYGRDVHLTSRERQTVVNHAYARGWSADRLAHTLSVSPDHARDLLTETAKQIRDRDRYQGMPPEPKRGRTKPKTAPATRQPAPHRDAATPVKSHLGKAA